MHKASSSASHGQDRRRSDMLQPLRRLRLRLLLLPRFAAAVNIDADAAVDASSIAIAASACDPLLTLLLLCLLQRLLLPLSTR